MNQTVIIAVAVIVVIALFLVLMLRSRKQKVTFGEQVAPPRPVTSPSTAPIIKAAAPVVEEGHGVSDEVAAAIEDVVDQFIGIDAHPSGQQAAAPAAAPGDTLTTLKGLGPKAASRLAELGVSHFAQIASWSEKEVEAIDAQMGTFKGRILRDRWVEQAKLLAAGDTEAFEAKFGKLGG
jgi:predicted flap endonuclease-1-like 5' DNA nuclease